MRWTIVRIAVPVILVAAALGLLVLRVSITRSIDSITGEALAASPRAADQVEALMIFVADEDHDLDRRNSAVWALGQLRDPRALPLLQGYETEGDCRHGIELCRRGLRKAVALCRDRGPDLLMIAAD